MDTSTNHTMTEPNVKPYIRDRGKRGEVELVVMSNGRAKVHQLDTDTQLAMLETLMDAFVSRLDKTL